MIKVGSIIYLRRKVYVVGLEMEKTRQPYLKVYTLINKKGRISKNFLKYYEVNQTYFDIHGYCGAKEKILICE